MRGSQHTLLLGKCTCVYELTTRLECMHGCGEVCITQSLVVPQNAWRDICCGLGNQVVLRMSR